MNRRRRLALLGAVLLLMLAAVDFRYRIYVPREVRLRDAAMLVPAQVPAAAPVAEIRRDLAQWLPGLAPVAAGEGGQQAKETGWSLALLGVFDAPGEAFAVIKATPAAGGAARVEQAGVGDELFGLRIESIQPRRVVLTSGAGEQVLELFKATQPKVLGTGLAPTGPVATAATTVPAGNGPAAPVPGRVTPQQLQSGESLKLPGNLPVQEGKLPPRDPNKKKPRLPSGPPPPPQNP